jgi:putative oxidoreductase
MSPIRLVARPLLASSFVLGAVNALRNAGPLAAKAKPVTDKVVPTIQKAVPQVPIPTDPKTLVQINAAAQIAAAVALARGKAPRISSAVLAASLVPTTVAGHAFWNETDKSAKQAQQLQFAKNLSMLGGLILAAVDTEGKPGVAWRARRAAKDVRRGAKRMAHDAQRETRLAAAKIG